MGRITEIHIAEAIVTMVMVNVGGNQIFHWLWCMDVWKHS